MNLVPGSPESRYPTYIIAILLLATLLRWPLLGANFASDDYSLLAAIERGDGHPAPLMNSKYDLWDFYDGVPSHTRAAIASGALPWWTAPEAKLALWRPLSSAVLTAVHARAGWRPRAYYGTTLIAFLVSIVAVAAVLRRIMPPPIAALATLIFSLHSVDAQSSNWISAIHLSISTALAMFALRAYIRSREDGWRVGKLVTVLLLAAALAAGEVALSALPLFFAYELSVASKGTARIRALVPPILLAGAYLVFYMARGYGARGISYYANPIEMIYSRPDRELSLVLQLFAQVPPWISGQLSDGRLLALALFFGACPTILIAALRRTRRSDRANELTLYWGAAAAISALPALGGPSSRGLFLASVPASAVLALLLVFGVRIWRGERSLAWQSAITVALMGAAAAQIPFPLITTAASAWQFRIAGDAELHKYSAIRPRHPASTDVILLNADDEASAVWGGVINKAAGNGEVRNWRVLSLFRGPMRLRRIAANGFELEAIAGGFDMDSYRDTRRYPFRPGDKVSIEGLTVEVKQVKDGTPVAIEVAVDRTLDDQSLYFVTRTTSGFQPVAIPPVGGTLRLGAQP